MPDLDTLSARYLDAQLAADRTEAVRLIIEEGAGRGVPVTDLLTRVILPAQREIGRLWQDNRITIADEHLATAISQLVIAQLYGRAERAPARGQRILVACVEGEYHDLGARVAADLLDLEGYDVQFAGANVPVDALRALVQRHQPDLVVLSVTMSFNAGALRRSVEAIREIPGRRIPIAAGGHAFAWAPGTGGRLDLVATGSDARELVSNVHRYFES